MTYIWVKVVGSHFLGTWLIAYYAEITFSPFLKLLSYHLSKNKIIIMQKKKNKKTPHPLAGFSFAEWCIRLAGLWYTKQGKARAGSLWGRRGRGRQVRAPPWGKALRGFCCAQGHTAFPSTSPRSFWSHGNWVCIWGDFRVCRGWLVWQRVAEAVAHGDSIMWGWKTGFCLDFFYLLSCILD